MTPIIICTKKDPFRCLEVISPEIYKISLSIEGYLTTDRRIACFYARLIAEQLIKMVFTAREIFLETDSLREMLKTPMAKEIINPVIIAKIESIARIGNKAAHVLAQPATQATLTCLRDLLDVSDWFARKFYDSKIAPIPSSQVFKEYRFRKYF
jgi:Domain of unknown function (DUF4145)